MPKSDEQNTQRQRHTHSCTVSVCAREHKQRIAQRLLRMRRCWLQLVRAYALLTEHDLLRSCGDGVGAHVAVQALHLLALPAARVGQACTAHTQQAAADKRGGEEASQTAALAVCVLVHRQKRATS